MTERNTCLRSAHDLGLAAWFGGAPMGAVGLNGGEALTSSCCPDARARDMRES